MATCPRVGVFLVYDFVKVFIAPVLTGIVLKLFSYWLSKKVNEKE
ncbi:type I toxin-antitoxin system Fst family toxin [Listeria innocua]|nr:type I toxin-antitoxin system Fst family toxin [Listeria innocua]